MVMNVEHATPSSTASLSPNTCDSLLPTPPGVEAGTMRPASHTVCHMIPSMSEHCSAEDNTMSHHVTQPLRRITQCLEITQPTLFGSPGSVANQADSKRAT